MDDKAEDFLREAYEKYVKEGHWSDAAHIDKKIQELRIKKQAALQAVANETPRPVPAQLPDWAIQHHPRFDNWINLMGLLWVRCQRLMGSILEGSSVPGKFGLSGNLGILDARDAIDNQDGQEKVAVIIQIDKRIMVLHDDPNLYPSDGLITQLVTLRDAAKGK
jgi:hypothetical protein